MLSRARVAGNIVWKARSVSLMAAQYLSSLSKYDLHKYLSTPPYTLPNQAKIIAPPMVYISGEEMTRYTMELMYVSIHLISIHIIASFLYLLICVLVWSSGSNHMWILAAGLSMICPANIVMILMIRS